VKDKATQLIHHGYQAPAGFAAPMPAVHKASTVFFNTCRELRERDWLDKQTYTYGLHGTPTTFELEARIAALEGAQHALLVPSGLAAIALVSQALLQQGDAVLLPDNVYGPSRALARHELRAWGIGHGFYDPMAPQALQVDAKTKLVWLEAAGSVTLEFPDLPALIQRIRAQAPHALIALDNTWGAGLAFDAFALGVDITIHALTKYPSGGGDVLMGSVCCRDPKVYEQLALCHSRLGLGVGMNDCELVLRNLPSLPLRYAAQDQAARRIALWAQTQTWVREVLHPALPTSPGHAAWSALCNQAAGLVGVRLPEGTTREAVEAWVDGLSLFHIGWSWGGPISLAVPYHLDGMRSLASSPKGWMVRLAIGLESPNDLIDDLARSAASVFADR
jgi:cystathionine beta-lyase